MLVRSVLPTGPNEQNLVLYQGGAGARDDIVAAMRSYINQNIILSQYNIYELFDTDTILEFISNPTETFYFDFAIIF